MLALITSVVWPFILNSILLPFWGYILAGSAAILGFLFSPTLRKYTIAVIAAALILGIVYLLGYEANHAVKVVTHTCEEFQKYLTVNSGSVKALATFKKHGLCE